MFQPFTENLSGLQHTKEGLTSELQLLLDIANNTDLEVQAPIKNSFGKFIVEFDYQKTTTMTSLTKWIDSRTLNKEDFSNPKIVKAFGTQTAKLHQYLRTYNRALQQVRPNYGAKRIDTMIQQIYRGIEKGLFSQSNFNMVEQSLNLISSRLVNLEGLNAWRIIHGDLNMSNVLVTKLGGVAFIDYSLFRYGYYLFDVAMGVDLGLKVPAVAVTDGDKVRFFGNVRRNKYMKRKFRSVRKQLGEGKQLNAIRQYNDKEQRWMKNEDHKVSRKIIDFAIYNNISVIRLEQLTNIRQTARTSRKNERNLHTWGHHTCPST
ncbi:transposase [Bacillus mycoides]|nr:transposase [Bacillus mycoides]OFD68831.1 transposase [Bacillus mycoides]OFD99159.1 transposase [Bacillus mycoides]